MNIKKIIITSTMIFLLITTYSCKKRYSNLDDSKKIELIQDTKKLKLLQDSFNATGNYKYMRCFIQKIDTMIVKYPEKKSLIQVKNSTLDIFGDSIKDNKQ